MKEPKYEIKEGTDVVEFSCNGKDSIAFLAKKEVLIGALNGIRSEDAFDMLKDITDGEENLSIPLLLCKDLWDKHICLARRNNTLYAFHEFTKYGSRISYAEGGSQFYVGSRVMHNKENWDLFSYCGSTAYPTGDWYCKFHGEQQG